MSTAWTGHERRVTVRVFPTEREVMKWAVEFQDRTMPAPTRFHFEEEDEAQRFATRLVNISREP